jgi:acyl carrier protein
MTVNREELKKQIIKELNLEELTVSDIADDDFLFGDNGIGLDSIDALELIVLLEKNYGVKLINPEDGKEVFESISTIANYIEKNT